jgi:hypothetical protein
MSGPLYASFLDGGAGSYHGNSRNDERRIIFLRHHPLVYTTIDLLEEEPRCRMLSLFLR